MRDAVTRLVLIRHGQAMAHVDQRIMSHNCEGLSPHGREQAAQLRDRLLRTGELRDATAFYASLMRRAQETAEIIAPAVGDGSLRFTADCGFCEQHHGEADGLTWAEYESRYGGCEAWGERDRRVAPGSESLGDLVARVGAALHNLAEDHRGETVVVVCHGGVVGSALEALTGAAMGTMARYTENTSLNEWAHDGERWLLVRFNDAAHLALA